MAYSRWDKSRFLTLCTSINCCDEDTFEIQDCKNCEDGYFMGNPELIKELWPKEYHFSYSQLKADITCLRTVEKISDAEFEELKGYANSFIKDVEDLMRDYSDQEFPNNPMKTYRVKWNCKRKIEKISGYNIDNAFHRAGYKFDAWDAIDWYEESKKDKEKNHDTTISNNSKN